MRKYHHTAVFASAPATGRDVVHTPNSSYRIINVLSAALSTLEVETFLSSRRDH